MSILLKISFLILTILFISCQENKSVKEKKDLNFEYANLTDFEIDSIYKSHSQDIVFLSFYPNMHYDIYRKYLKIEQENGNLIFGVAVKTDNDGEFYIFYIDSTNVYDPLFSSRSAVATEISMNKYSVNLKTRKPILKSQYDMVIDLFESKYGKPKDTIFDKKDILFFSAPQENKIITINLNKENILSIDYYTMDSMSTLNNDILKEKKKKDSLILEMKNTKSNKEDVLEKI